MLSYAPDPLYGIHLTMNTSITYMWHPYLYKTISILIGTKVRHVHKSLSILHTMIIDTKRFILKYHYNDVIAHKVFVYFLMWACGHTDYIPYAYGFSTYVARVHNHYKVEVLAS